MGSFFANVQVHAGDAPQVVRAAIVDALRSELAAKGLEEAGKKERAEYTIVVGPTGTWIAVYDEDDDQLEERAAMLSKVTKRQSVSVRVHDDDVIDLALWGGGKTLDRWCSAPDYVEERSKADRVRLAGKPAAWSTVIAKGGAKALAAAWRKRETFASEHVVNLAPVLGWDAELARLGVRYLEDCDALDGATWLRFKRARGKLQIARGETSLAIVGAPVAVDGVVGRSFDLPVTLRNQGGPGKRVNVWLDEAIDGDPLLEVTEVVWEKTAVKPILFKNARGIPREVLEQLAPDSRELYVRFADVVLAAGVVEPASAHGLGQELIDARRRAEVELRIKGTFRKAGATQLFISVSPSDWPIEQDSTSIRFAIKPR